MRTGPKGLLRDQERQVIQCSNCYEIKSLKETYLKHPQFEATDVRAYGSLCIICHKEYKTTWAKNFKQKKLELAFSKNEKGIHFCECGDYFVNRKNTFSTCWNCRRGKND